MAPLVFLNLLLLVIKAHFYKCPDIYQNACKSSKCSSKDADKRALYFCDEWPYWSGGWGSFDEEHESYSCMNSTNSYCSVWSTQETKFRKNSTGTCFCIDHSINSNETNINIIPSTNYCSFWICTEYQIFTNCKEDPYTESEICEDLLDKEYNECHCLKASINDQYCMEWQCLQLKNDEIQETANYLCDSDELKENVTNINYCEYWSGDIESEWEFEILDCHCDIIDNSSNFCIKWECVEKEMIKHYSSGDKYGYFHAIFWPLFCSCLLGGSCISGTKSVPATAIMVVIVVCSVGVISGGVGFLMIWLIIFGIPILLFCCSSIIHEMQYKRQTKNEQNDESKSTMDP